MTIWKTQNVQIVWFLSTADNVRANDIYEQIVGEEPVSYQSNKVPNPANPYLGVAAGRMGEYAATVQLQPGRVDFLVTPSQETNDEADGLGLLETERALEAAVSAISKAKSIPSVRLALVLNILEPAKDLTSARKLVERWTDFEPKFGDYSDFMLQINRRMTLPEPRIEINRLLRYGSLTLQSFSFQIQPGSAPTSINHERYAANIVIDLNTVMDGRTLDSKQVVPIFHAMAKEALRIASSGQLSTLEQ